MKKNTLINIVGAIGTLAVAGLAYFYGDKLIPEKKDGFPQTVLTRYYTEEGKDYAELMHSYRFGMRNMPGSFIKSERYSVPSNSVPDRVVGERIR